MLCWKKIPDEVINYSRKYREKYIKKGQYTIMEAWGDIVQDYFMKNKVSYRHYSDIWGWDKKTAKRFINLIGLEIETTPNQYKMGILKKSPPSPHHNNKKSPPLFNIFNKLYDNEHHHDKEKSPPSPQKEYKKKRIYKTYMHDLDEKNIKNEFEKWWKIYSYMIKKMSEDKPDLKVMTGKKKTAFSYYKELVKKYSPCDILNISKGYLTERYRANIKPRSNEYFLKKELMVDFGSLKEAYHEIGAKIKLKGLDNGK